MERADGAYRRIVQGSTDMTDMTIDLSGRWMCRLDSEDHGLAERWQGADAWRVADDGAGEIGGAAESPMVPFIVPGTAGANGLGTAYEPPEPLAVNEECMQSLRQRHDYLGALWLARWVDMPANISVGACAELFLERVIFGSMAWLDGHYVGEDDSLATAHRHDLTDFVRPGARQLLVVRIDNRDLKRLGTWGSSYTNETQSIWNGIVGEASLRFRSSAVSDVQVFPDVAANALTVRFDLGASHGAVPSTISVVVRDSQGSVVAELADAPVQAGHNAIRVSAPGLEPWNEFHPTLYTLTVGDAEPVRFGMRTLASGPDGLTINGRGMFLRGNVECCVFPETGFPPCDEASWERMYTKLKALGFNHVRFHSWCPPEAAFAVADRMGLYLQVEGPVWLDAWFDDQVGSHAEHYGFIRSELCRIVRDHANHPSFCLLACGNELSGDFTLLEDILRELREQDGRVLTTLTSNTVDFDRAPSDVDDCYVGVSYERKPIRGQYDLDGMVGGTALAYDPAVAAAPLPLVSHEVGQYVVFPDMKEIDDYTGTLEPVNLTAVRADLEAKELLPLASEFTRASAHLAQAMYRADVESMLRTRGLAGVQLLSLQDFPGQKTATVGLLNGFWQEKSDEPIDLHWGPVTPLAIMDRLRYRAGETLHADIKVSNFGPCDLPAGRWDWSLVPVLGDGSDDADAAPVAAGSFDAPAIAQGRLSDVVGTIDVRLDGCADRRLRLTVRDGRGSAANSWDVWVFGMEDATGDEGGTGFRSLLADDIVVSTWFDDDIRAALDGGRTCVVLADPNAMRVDPAGGEFFPVFWSPMHFPSVSPCGMWCEAGSPAFAGFPTGRYADLNWKDPLEHSFSMDITSLPRDFRPLTTVVPNFATIAWRTNMFECQVGEGRLFVVSIDLDSGLPSVRSLARSLAAHINDRGFVPEQRLEAGQVADLFIDPEGPEAQARGRLSIDALRIPRDIPE